MHQPRHPRKIPAGRTEPLRAVVVKVVSAQGTGEPQPRVRPPARRSRRLPQTTIHITPILKNPGLNPRIPPRSRTGTTATTPTGRHHPSTAERNQPRKCTTTHHRGTHAHMVTAEPRRGPRDTLPMRDAGLRGGQAPPSRRRRARPCSPGRSRSRSSSRTTAMRQSQTHALGTESSRGHAGPRGVRTPQASDQQIYQYGNAMVTKRKWCARRWSQHHSISTNSCTSPNNTGTSPSRRR